jgi:hypothetical protein
MEFEILIRHLENSIRRVYTQCADGSGRGVDSEREMIVELFSCKESRKAYLTLQCPSSKRPTFLVNKESYPEFMRILKAGLDADAGTYINGPHFSSSVPTVGKKLEVFQTEYDAEEGSVTQTMVYHPDFWKRILLDLSNLDLSNFSRSSRLWKDFEMKPTCLITASQTRSLTEALLAPRSCVRV